MLFISRHGESYVSYTNRPLPSYLATYEKSDLAKILRDVGIDNMDWIIDMQDYRARIRHALESFIQYNS